MSLQMGYNGRNRVPGISTAVETFENEILWGTYESIQKTGLIIDAAARDVGNTGKTHILRAGLLMGLNESTGKLHPWTPTANDGTEYVWGVLLESINMFGSDASGVDRLTGNMVCAGGLLADQLIIPGTTARGLSGNALEMLSRLRLRQNFRLNDSYQYGRPINVITVPTADEITDGITLTVNDSHKEFHSESAITITLPATPYKGVEYTFFGNGDEITVASGSSNILVPGAALANSLAVDDIIRRVVGDGTQWVVYAL